MRLADLALSGIAVDLDQDGSVLIDAPQGALTPELLAQIRKAKPGLVAELRAGRERCELGELGSLLASPTGENIGPGAQVHAATLAADPNAMIQAAAEGLMTPEALRRALGVEGMEDLVDGELSDDALRCFAESLAARWARGKALPDEQPDPAPACPDPSPLGGLPLLREDRQFLDARTRYHRNPDDLLRDYARVWREAADAEPVEIRKANAGRFAANSWLREVKR